jgi:hypothetical protein
LVIPSFSRASGGRHPRPDAGQHGCGTAGEKQARQFLAEGFRIPGHASQIVICNSRPHRSRDPHHTVSRVFQHAAAQFKVPVVGLMAPGSDGSQAPACEGREAAPLRTYGLMRGGVVERFEGETQSPIVGTDLDAQGSL